MTWEAVVRFVPAYDSRHLIDGAENPPALVVSHDALHRKKLNEPIPVVIDHELDRVIGHVESTFVGEDVDYGVRVRKWWFAACELDERPEWLKRGGGVSWAWHPAGSYMCGDTEVLISCVIEELSLLSPALNPAEPLARVGYVKRHQPQPQPEPEPGGQVFGHGQMLYRPNIGTFLGVR